MIQQQPSVWHVSTHTHTHLHTHTHTTSDTHKYTYVYTLPPKCTHTHTQIHIREHPPPQMHTRSHTYTHTSNMRQLPLQVGSSDAHPAAHTLPAPQPTVQAPPPPPYSSLVIDPSGIPGHAHSNSTNPTPTSGGLSDEGGAAESSSEGATPTPRGGSAYPTGGTCKLHK